MKCTAPIPVHILLVKFDYFDLNQKVSGIISFYVDIREDYFFSSYLMHKTDTF